MCGRGGSGYSIGVIYRCRGDTRAFCHLSVPEIPGAGFPLGMLLGFFGDTPSSGIWDSVLSFHDSVVFICTGDHGVSVPASLFFEVLFLEVQAPVGRAGGRGSRSFYFRS